MNGYIKTGNLIIVIIINIIFWQCSNEYYDKSPNIPTERLVAYYPLNGNAQDSSGNNNHGSIFDVTFSSDKNGNIQSCANFDGRNDRIDLPLSFDYEERTINIWFNANNIDTIIGIIYESDNAELLFGQTQLGVIELSDGKKLNFLIGDPSINHYYHNIEEYKWYMLTAVINKHSIKYYLNSELLVKKDSINNVHSLDGNLFATLGAHRKNGYNFNGRIDNVRIYNRELLNEEIQELYKE